MTADDMTQLVRDDALNFIRGIGFGNQAGIDVNRLSARGERVDGLIADQQNLDIGGLQACSANDRFADFPEKRLGFGVAQHALRRRGADRDNQGQE